MMEDGGTVINGLKISKIPNNIMTGNMRVVNKFQLICLDPSLSEVDQASMEGVAC